MRQRRSVANAVAGYEDQILKLTERDETIATSEEERRRRERLASRCLELDINYWSKFDQNLKDNGDLGPMGIVIDEAITDLTRTTRNFPPKGCATPERDELAYDKADIIAKAFRRLLPSFTDHSGKLWTSEMFGAAVMTSLRRI